MRISIPDLALVVLIGPTGSGKPSFARRHFLETEILSSDHCRALVVDDETDQAATRDASDLLRYTAAVRLKRRLQKEGFRQVYVMNAPAEVDALEIERQPLWTDRRG